MENSACSLSPQPCRRNVRQVCPIRRFRNTRTDDIHMPPKRVSGNSFSQPTNERMFRKRGNTGCIICMTRMSKRRCNRWLGRQARWVRPGRYAVGTLGRVRIADTFTGLDFVSLAVLQLVPDFCLPVLATPLNQCYAHTPQRRPITARCGCPQAPRIRKSLYYKRGKGALWTFC